MITLITGVPGSGKTLRALAEVKALAEKDSRPVYYSGINELALSWLEIDPSKWFEAESGAIIVIDECQTVFRPRGNAAAVPEAVARLETHRHAGHDLFLITQHPMLIDPNIRRLVGRHLHVSRRFGLSRATILEFPSCKDQPLSKMADARRHEWAFPKEAYSWYKSAEVHTHKISLPPKFIILLLIPFVLGAIVWFMYDRWEAKIKPAAMPVATPVYGGPPGVVRPVVPTLEPLPTTRDYPNQSLKSEKSRTVADYNPRVQGLPHTAPVYDDLTKPTRVPLPAACVDIRGACKCYTQQGTILSVHKELCLEIVKKGYFVDFDDGQRRRLESTPVAPQSSAVPVSLAVR